MNNVLLCYRNRADAATLTGGSWHATLGRDNLKDGNIDKAARTAAAALSSTRFAGDLGAAYPIKALALVNHNLSTAATWRVRLGATPLDLDFVNAAVDGRLTCSGGANGTRVNAAGLVVAATTPRIDYDSATLACLGLLVEPAATNLALWCRDATNAAWAKTSITASRCTGADGVANSGSTLTATGANGTCLQAIASAITDRATGAWVKRRSGAGAVEMTQNNGATWSAITVTGAWTRVAIPSASLANPTVGVRLVTSGDAIDFDYFQAETGTIPTSAIATGAASVTRTADSVVVAAAALDTTWFSAGAGTLYADFAPNTDSAAVLAYIGAALSDGVPASGANRMAALARTNGDVAEGLVTTGGVTQAQMVAAVGITYNTSLKTALAYAANDFAFCFGGGAVVTDAAGTVPPVSQVDIGQQGALNFVCGHVRRVAYWPTRLSNAQLQSLTTSGPDALLTYDSGFVAVKTLTFAGDTPSDWGARYNVLHLPATPQSARYLSVEISDAANAAGYVQIGRLFVGGVAIQPARNVSYAGLRDGQDELSSVVRSVSGKEYGTERRRRRTADFAINWLTQAEADAVHEMRDAVGVVGEVLLVPDSADMARSQRYGGLGMLAELSAIDYPYVNTRATAVRWKEKL